jgi:hypothetical protein
MLITLYEKHCVSIFPLLKKIFYTHVSLDMLETLNVKPVTSGVTKIVNKKLNEPLCRKQFISHNLENKENK